MKLLRTSIFSAIITFVRIASGFVAGKVIAFFIGPSGVALIGQFSNFISVVLTFSNGAINNGVIKYTAQFNGNDDSSKQLFSTAFKISFFCSAVVGVILFVFSNFFSNFIFDKNSFSLLIRVFGGTVLFYSLNTLLISILNGKEEIRKYTIVNTISVLIGLVFTILLVYYFKIQGALYALILSQSIVFFLTVFLVSNTSWFNFNYFFSPFNMDMALKLGRFSLMAIASVLTIPISQILLRNLMINKLGVDWAGYWQGMTRISDGYLMLITTSLSTYYLPKLSSLKTDNEIRYEVINGLKIIVPIVFTGAVVIYLCRFFIINLLYTKEFFEMEQLFLFQLGGDVLKIASWLIGYIMIARAMTKSFIFLEIFFRLKSHDF
jgi:PST family polysaccharide transporter